MIIKGIALKYFDWTKAGLSNNLYYVTYQGTWPSGEPRTEKGVLLGYSEKNQLINVGQFHTHVKVSDVIEVKLTESKWV